MSRHFTLRFKEFLAVSLKYGYYSKLIFSQTFSTKRDMLHDDFDLKNETTNNNSTQIYCLNLG